MKTLLAPLGLVVALCAPALAASPQVGEEAPEFSSTSWVFSPPGGKDSIKALRGEVVFVEKWGVNCPPCRALMPHLQRLWDEHGGKGLHVFAFEAQNHSADEIRTCLTQNGHKSYPVSAAGANNYQTDGGIPHGWLIGVDGKVIWQGNPGDGKFDQMLKEELAKVRFPGLGRSDFDKAVNKSLGLYAKRDLGGARREAQKIAENEKSEMQARADAQWLVERFTKLGEEQLALADGYVGERRYLEAQEVLSFLAATFKKEPEGNAAQEKLDGFKDPAVKKELDAAKKLQKLLAALQNRPAAERKANLEKFASKVEGTRAAEEALAAAASATK